MSEILATAYITRDDNPVSTPIAANSIVQALLGPLTEDDKNYTPRRVCKDDPELGLWLVQLTPAEVSDLALQGELVKEDKTSGYKVTIDTP